MQEENKGKNMRKKNIDGRGRIYKKRKKKNKRLEEFQIHKWMMAMFMRLLQKPKVMARSRTASPQGAKAMTGVTPQQSGKAAIFSPG